MDLPKIVAGISAGAEISAVRAKERMAQCQFRGVLHNENTMSHQENQMEGHNHG